MQPEPVGILTFEVASLMSKTVHLWHSLSDDQISRLHNETLHLLGVRKLVSDNDDFLLDLAVAELRDSFTSLSRSVARLGTRCTNPILQRLDLLFPHFTEGGADLYGLEYAGKKIDRKVRKMERFVATCARLYHELERLAQLEHGSKRLARRFKLETQKQEVERLKENSLWVRSFDYTVRLLARSLITILSRMRLVFGDPSPTRILDRAIHPAEVIPVSRFCLVGKNSHLTHSTPSIKTKWYVPMRHLIECVAGGNGNAYGEHSPLINESFDSFQRNRKLLKAPPTTLGAAALAVHYANMIILIEKLVLSPRLICPDARGDLYDMLTANIKVSLVPRLREGARDVGSRVRAVEVGEEMRRTLEWLGPMARNMVRWQGERNFEQRQPASSASVMLLQTLYFADQVKTEAAIVELLVGLSFLWRFGREGRLGDCNEDQ